MLQTHEIHLSVAKMNGLLHFQLGVHSFYDRMVLTACVLVAKQYGAVLTRGMQYMQFHNAVQAALARAIEEPMQYNPKVTILIEMFENVQIDVTNNQKALDAWIELLDTISALMNAGDWQGEDVMGLLFREYNHYKGKSEHGQVFTPEHVTALMYRLIDVDPQKDRILDAACGSGTFLMKSLSFMSRTYDGSSEEKQDVLNRLFGIELDKRVYALACANLLIQGSNVINLEQMDSTSQEACDWIQSKQITKVLMNPPYEKCSHPEIIIQNVLDHIQPQAIAAFLLPDKKLEKIPKAAMKRIFNRHRLLKIIKLPEVTFDVGVTTSIFLFESGVPQDHHEIFTCHIKYDGLERVKNEGRQDIHNRWPEIEDRWVNIIQSQAGDDSIKWINPAECISYPVPEDPLIVSEEVFFATMMDYQMFVNNIDVKDLGERIAYQMIYLNYLSFEQDGRVSIALKGEQAK